MPIVELLRATAHVTSRISLQRVRLSSTAATAHPNRVPTVLTAAHRLSVNKFLEENVMVGRFARLTWTVGSKKPATVAVAATIQPGGAQPTQIVGGHQLAKALQATSCVATIKIGNAPLTQIVDRSPLAVRLTQSSYGSF